MWVVPSPLLFRRRGPHIKNFRVGPEMGDVGCVSFCLCAFFALDKRGENFFNTQPQKNNGFFLNEVSISMTDFSISGLMRSPSVGFFWLLFARGNRQMASSHPCPLHAPGCKSSATYTMPHMFCQSSYISGVNSIQ